jgi:single-strand DNA-binding protein
MSAPLRLLQLNDVRLVGRLTRDPELKFTTSGTAVCRFDLAVNRSFKDPKTGEWKDDPAYVPVVVWREAAQRCGDRLKKGSPAYVEGRLKSRTWETKDGQKRFVLEVDARGVQFLEKADGSGMSAPLGGDEEPAPLGAAPSESPAPSVEEVPF